MKILLIRPPYSRLRGSGHTAYFPLGLGYLAAVTRDIAEVAIYNADNPKPSDPPISYSKASVFYTRSKAFHAYLEALDDPSHPVWADTKQVIYDFKPDLVGISVLSAEVGSALAVSELVKRIDSEITVVWGGVHPSFVIEQSIASPAVDYLILYEAELSFRELIVQLGSANPDLTRVPGLVYRRGDSIEVNQPAPLIGDLDSLPFPAKDLALFPKQYHPLSWGSIIGARGCPYKCAFCSSRDFWQNRTRYRSPNSIVEEIKHIIAKYKVRYFSFWDDSFSLKRSWTLELCKAIVEHGLNIYWRTATRVDLIDDEMLRYMKKAGCVQLELGVESGSPRISQMIDKQIDLAKIKPAVSAIRNAGIACGAFFMAGFPKETEQDIAQTFQLMQQISADELVLNIFDPMPGAPLFKQAVELGLIEQSPDWSRFPYWPDAHYVKDIEAQQFNEIVERIASFVFRYNNSPQVLYRRLKPKFLAAIKTDPISLIKRAYSMVKLKK